MVSCETIQHSKRLLAIDTGIGYSRDSGATLNKQHPPADAKGCAIHAVDLREQWRKMAPSPHLHKMSVDLCAPT